MNYAVEQRLRFIDFLLHQYGLVNRSALTDYFGISEPQATRDFQEYKSIAPDNMEYGSVSKAYLRTEKFTRVWP